jgi:metal-responsive CopG/Arc/MetJ family transcriptional regulator
LPHTNNSKGNKNDHDVKVWMPEPLVGRIDELADGAGISRSEYLRETLVGHLFGRAQLPDRR